MKKDSIKENKRRLGLWMFCLLLTFSLLVVYGPFSFAAEEPYPNCHRR
jgi:hypothetical protein